MKSKLIVILSSLLGSSMLITACGGEKSTGIDPQKMADSLHAVMEADRTVYTRLIINRLAKEEKVRAASWR